LSGSRVHRLIETRDAQDDGSAADRFGKQRIVGAHPGELQRDPRVAFAQRLRHPLGG
jgi:hypothetical protein